MEDPAWGELSETVAAAPYPVEVLPADPARAAACLAVLGITTRSWLGALVANAGGLLVDHGWLRVLGSGYDPLPDVATAAGPGADRLVVGYDVMGGQFAWLSPRSAAKPTVHYFGPDTLGWQDLELGYGDWLHAMLSGVLADFYDSLRWPGWETETAALGLGQGISAWPPPWSEEGKDLSSVSRGAVPLAELVSFYEDTARQTGPTPA